MRNYWSLSPLAHYIRKVFGVPKMPYALSFEGWEEYHKSCKTTPLKRVGNWLADDLLNALQGIVMFVPDKIDSAIYFLSNVKNSTHTLPTNCKVGQWQDLSTRIPDAIFNAIVNFVEKECFWMWVMCNAETDYDDADVRAYGRQSYIRRKLFPLYISEEKRAKYGIRWLEFQNEHMEDKSMYLDLIAAYQFTKNRYTQFDAYEETGYNEFKRAYGKDAKLPEDFYDRLFSCKEEFKKECTKHLMMIVKYRDALWT